jgi:CrcB protein
MAFMGPASSLPPEWRLFVITGFLGGLTTFSTFSAEVTTALQQGPHGLGADLCRPGHGHRA